MRTTRRQLVFAAGIALGLVVLASCTVPVDGVTGVAIDPSGRLMGVIASCDHRINEAVLYQTNGRTAEQEGPTISAWDLHGDSTRSELTWPLNGPSNEVATATMSSRELPRQRHISLYGATHDNSYSTIDVTFRLEETQSLRHGQILMWDPASVDSERDRNKIVSTSEFRRAACDE